MRKINTKAPKATKPVTAAVAAKPVKAAKPDSKADQRKAASDAVAAFYAAGRQHYTGASNVIHTRKAGTRDAYAARVKQPVQIAANGASERDHALLRVIAANAKAGAFDPVALAADAGVISRLASINFIAMRGDEFILTPAGAERASLLAKRG